MVVVAGRIGSASAVVGRPGHAQRATRGRNAEPWPELRHRCHQDGSASGGASSNTESLLRNTPVDSTSRSGGGLENHAVPLAFERRDGTPPDMLGMPAV